LAVLLLTHVVTLYVLKSYEMSHESQVEEIGVGESPGPRLYTVSIHALSSLHHKMDTCGSCWFRVRIVPVINVKVNPGRIGTGLSLGKPKQDFCLRFGLNVYRIFGSETEEGGKSDYS
jgi:hypothetical protein